MARVLGALLLLAFTVYTLVDCVQSDDARVRSLPKLAWALIILVFPVVGGISWWLAGRPGPGGWSLPGGPGSPGSPGGRGNGPRGPLGPDDDPDFLRKL